MELEYKSLDLPLSAGEETVSTSGVEAYMAAIRPAVQRAFGSQAVCRHLGLAGSKKRGKSESLGESLGRKDKIIGSSNW